VQCVVTGDFGQGKSTTAVLLAKYDTIATREILKIENWREYLKYGDKIHFNLQNHVIISPADPANKFVKKPKPYNAYEDDEGYLRATTSEASTHATKEFIDSIVQNRKLHPSFYHVYPNLFKMPSRVLELMNEVVHKIYVDKAALFIPTRMVQLSEKFDRATLERFAKNPRRFERSIQYHPTFVAFMRTPDWSAELERRYLEKYEKYKIVESQEESKKADAETSLFTQIDSLAKRGTIMLETKADVESLLYSALKEKLGERSAKSMASLLAERYVTWKENQAARYLSDRLSATLAGKLKIDLKELGLDDDNAENVG